MSAPARNDDAHWRVGDVSGNDRGKSTCAEADSTATVKERESRRAAYLATVPPLYRGTFDRAFEANSRAAAIRAKCLDCCHFMRAEIEACTVITCPLHPIRPYQAKRAGTRPAEMPANLTAPAFSGRHENNSHSVRGRYAPAPQNAAKARSSDGADK